MTTDPSPAECLFADLRLDALDAHGVATVWAGLLSRDLAADVGGSWHVVAREDDRAPLGLRVVPVSEPPAAATRVRLDVQLAAHDVNAPLIAGASLVSAPGNGGSWWVLGDPEGNRLHAMPPPPPELHIPPVDTTTPFELVVEAADPQALAEWWAARTGGRARTRPGVTFWWVDGAAGFPLMFWMFVAETGPRTGRNRMRWGVVLRDGSPQALLDAGAALLEPDDGSDGWLLADPEGNEFRALAPES